MLLSNVKEIEIPEGKIKQISKGSTILWKKKGIRFVNFLVSNGPQYINTGLTGGKYIIEFGAQALSMPSNGTLPVGTTFFYIFFPTDSTGAYNTQGVQTVFNLTTLQYHVYRHDGSNLFVDGVHAATRGIAGTAGALYLFKASGYMDRLSTTKMSYCKIWDITTNELLRDYVPALDENGRAGFFDRVSQTFKFSESGEFLYE